MTTVNVPVGNKTFRKMLMVDPEAAMFKTPQAPLVSDAEKRQDAPARRRRPQPVAVASLMKVSVHCQAYRVQPLA